MVDPFSGPNGKDGKPIGARVKTDDDVDLAIVVLKIEPRSLDRSIAKQIGPPIKPIEGMILFFILKLSLSQWGITF